MTNLDLKIRAAPSYPDLKRQYDTIFFQILAKNLPHLVSFSEHELDAVKLDFFEEVHLAGGGHLGALRKQHRLDRPVGAELEL